MSELESKLNKKFAEGVSLLSSLNELLFEYHGSDESEGGDGVELLSKLKNLRILNLSKSGLTKTETTLATKVPSNCKGYQTLKSSILVNAELS